ncbi:hypothetical protein O6H91_09G011500 [Diphasiastrum complanatum]|uniref:Uncharacterized protein n=1 Tax=Diphasiastrum complanatum TaxID=34168 RepID=A0ACC2CLA2_DIPCM|nr:hypothetical protein O6H91_09G011500 [Diphasiastrum complanatum]
MSGRDRETEGRFLHLLQPNRDLAANWSVDVAQELEGYLAEISLTTLFEDGQNSLNFAEAALLIQGSIQIYSRKVEYLYALVLQALDVIGNKKQAQLETSSIQGDGKDADVEQEEEEFLNLDDVPEEPNIDIENEGSGGYITPVVKPPSSLLVVEGDALHAAGDVGELETYQIATSSLHRDFLLLDPCDAETVDIYLNTTRFSKRSARRTPRHLSSASRSKTQKSNFSTPGRRASSAKKAEASEAFRIDVQDPIQAFDSVGGRWEDLSGEDHVRNIDFEDPDLDGNSEDNHENNAFHGEKEEDEDDDPWAPLNPHDLGTLPIKPFKKGQLYRKQKLKDHYLSGEEVEFPLASRNGVTLPEFAEAWHKRQADARRRQTAAGDSATLYEKLRSSFQNSDEDLQKDSLDGSGVSQDNSWDNCEHSDEDYDAPQLFESSLPFDQPEDNPTETESLDFSNEGNHHREEEMAFEDLCRAHMDRMLQKLAESEVRTELASRVSNWKLKIEMNLEEQESRPPFDIHAYGEQLMSKLTTNISTMKDMDCEQGVYGKQSFACLVQGQRTHEVARSFAALLQLVNNGNVTIEQNSFRKACHCFTREDSFTVKILSVQKRHEEMLQYQAPSRAAKASTKAGSSDTTQLRSSTVETQPVQQNPVKGSVKIKCLQDVDTRLQSHLCSPSWISPNSTAASDSSPTRKTKSTTYSRFGTNEPESDDPENMIPSGGNVNTTLSKLTPQGKRRRKIQALTSVQIQFAH